MAHGRFVWHDLVTRDVDAARDFYTGLFGWTLTHTEQTQGGPYPILHDGHRAFGGLLAMTEEWGDMPPHWGHYIEVRDLDDAMARVVAAGGAVNFGPLSIPETGRFCQIQDDQGVHVHLIELNDSEPVFDEHPAHGQFCWYTLLTRDVARAKAFWTAALGWEVVPFDEGDGVQSEIFAADGLPVASLHALDGDGPPAPFWAASLATDDIEATWKEALARGATGRMPPTPQGTLGIRALLADPTGAAINLWQHRG